MSSASIRQESATCIWDTADIKHHELEILIIEHLLQSYDVDLEHLISFLLMFSNRETVAKVG